MIISLYQNLDSHNTLNKRKTLLDSYEITLKKQTNILNPTIPLYIEGELPQIDYAYIDDLQRYYHISNIEPKTNNVYVLYLEVDVIESYKDDIINATKVNYSNAVKPEITILESDYTPENEVSYILSTISGDSMGEVE